MIRVFFWAALFVTAAAATLVLGLAFLIAPARIGAFLGDYFAVFPAPSSRRSRMLYRLLGALLALFGVIQGMEVGKSILKVMFGKFTG